jgi:tetratricopeptide (TPR) repeat protein
MGAARGGARAPSAAPAGGGGGKKKLVIAIAAVLVLGGGGAGAFFMFGNKGGGAAKPDYAGTVKEGNELWKKIAEHIQDAQNKDDAGARGKALQEAQAKIEEYRKVSDAGWPDHFAGRVLAMQEKFDEAKSAYDKAIEKLGPKEEKYPKVEKALVATRQAQEMLLRSRRFRAAGPSPIPDPEVAAIETAALADLKLISSGMPSTEFFTGARASLAEGESLRIEGRNSTAQNQLGSAIGSRAEESYAGAVYAAIHFEFNKPDLAIRAMDAAVDSGKGSPFARLSRAWALRKRALDQPDNQDATGWLDKAIEDADAARAAGHRAGGVAAAACRLDRALREVDRGGAPGTRLDEAESILTDEKSKSAADPTVGELLAAALILRAQAEEKAGKDGRASFDRGLSALDAAAGSDDAVLSYRARSLMRRGHAESVRGGDPRPFYDRAVADFDAIAAKAGKAGASEAIYGRALALVEKGAEDSKRGQDATASLQKAVADMTEVLSARPNEMAALEARGLAQVALGESMSRAGDDKGVEMIDRGVTDLDKVLETNPKNEAAAFRLVDAWMAHAAAKAKTGFDASQSFDRAVDVMLKLLEKTPGSVPLLMKCGKTRNRAAEIDCVIGDRDARIKCTAAVQNFSDVLKAEPDNLEALFERGRSLYLTGRSEGNTGADPRVSYNSAARDLEKVLQKQADHLPCMRVLADSIFWLARVDDARGTDAHDSYVRAQRVYETALKALPDDGELRKNAGFCWVWLARAKVKRNEDPGSLWTECEAHCLKAIELGWTDANLPLGRALMGMKKFDESRAALEVALKSKDKRVAAGAKDELEKKLPEAMKAAGK